jgi:hypothetical protein
MWQAMMEVLTTCSIVTNCALVGFVSHGLLFYFPDMTSNERVRPRPRGAFHTRRFAARRGSN